MRPRNLKYSQILFISVLGLVCPAVMAEPTHELITFDSPRGIEIFGQARYKLPFFGMVNYFEAQKNVVNCGPTSLSVVLNALRFKNPNYKKPLDATTYPKELTQYLPEGVVPVFERYTQDNVFLPDHRSAAEMFGSQNREYGFELGHLADLARGHKLHVDMLVAPDNKDEWKSLKGRMIEALQKPGVYIIVNFKRSAIGQNGGGHFSPVGAYDEVTDSFLIVDVNFNKAFWTWVPADTLLTGMATKDTSQNRGLLILKELQKLPDSGDCGSGGK
jgi:hypothetical protein